jgi:[ribosomal protein S18]-alanine N-acetyltransferase
VNSETTTVTVRTMRWWDIEPVMQLERDLFGDEAWAETMFWNELAESASRHYLVAETTEKEVIAYAGLCAYPPHESYVQTIAVAAAHQGHGLGTTLLTQLIEESAHRGCKRLDLEVRADNPAAIGLYERHAFTRVGLRRGYYQPSGVDAVVMRRVQT